MLQTAHTASRVWEILDTVPPAMAASYQKALARSFERCEEKKLLAGSLAWTLGSTEPQTTAELRGRLETEMGERVFGLRRFLETRCADFLVVDLDERVIFVHETARQFLIDSADSDLLSYR